MYHCALSALRIRSLYHLLSSADSKDLAKNRSKGRLTKQRSLLRKQVSLRDDIVSEPNLSNSEADSVEAGSTASVNAVVGSGTSSAGRPRNVVGGSLRSIAAAKLLRKSGICESCVQVGSRHFPANQIEITSIAMHPEMLLLYIWANT